jgi:hypothetical protein
MGSCLHYRTLGPFGGEQLNAPLRLALPGSRAAFRFHQQLGHVVPGLPPRRALGLGQPGDMEVEVEILDVNDAEARALLLSIDPLAALARTQTQLHDRLPVLTPTVFLELEAAWQAAAAATLSPTANPKSPKDALIPEQFFVLVTCRDEKQQVELLTRFSGEGLECRALLT